MEQRETERNRDGSDRERKDERLSEDTHWVIACLLLANSFGRELLFPLQQVTTSFHNPFLIIQSHCRKKNDTTQLFTSPIKTRWLLQDRKRLPAQREWETQQRTSSLLLPGLCDLWHLYFLKAGLKQLQTGNRFQTVHSLQQNSLLQKYWIPHGVHYNSIWPVLLAS